MATLMQCGCVTSAIRSGTQDPVCLTHWGVREGWDKPAEGELDLSERVAVCSQCRKETPSDPKLPFFKHRLDAIKDSYYCGCAGWN